jgi:hypothetical protein
MANRFDRMCTCDSCADNPSGRKAKSHTRINRLMGDLNEKDSRRVAGLIATELGHGGVVEVSQITGMSRTTIAKGRRELDEKEEVPLGRVRRPGGGRPALEKKDRG